METARLPIPVHTHLGKLPAMWDRSAIFVANIYSLFFGNEAQEQVLEGEIHGVHTYGGRLIPIIDLLYRGGKNVLAVECTPDESLMVYFSEELGLNLPLLELLPRSTYTALTPPQGDESTTKNVEVDDVNLRQFLKRMRKHPAAWVDGFVTDDRLRHFAARLGKQTVTQAGGSRMGNNKVLLHNHLAGQGLPTFDTIMVENLEQTVAGMGRLMERGYVKVALKAPLGASGIGIIQIETAGTIPPVPEYMFFEGPCMLQGWIDGSMRGVKPMGSPSVQMFLADGHVTLFDITDQVLSPQSVHEGNVAPPPYLAGDAVLRDELLRQAAVAGQWLHGQGYRGTASTDFLVIERGGSREVYICEVNARVTGATYPSLLARHFMPEGAWAMRNLRFQPPMETRDLMHQLAHGRLLYRPGDAMGVLPVNFNLNAEGSLAKGQFLCLGTTLSECLDLLEQMQHILPLAWQYDRD